MESATQTDPVNSKDGGCSSNLDLQKATIMDGMNCHYQVHPFTKEPLLNKDGSLANPVCKSNFGFMMDAIRDIALSDQHSKKEG